ncbi:MULTISPECIES: hypothetical protein [Staphylococcus]|uniref:hypothetical protein n=1 Tax=Staphylococcus TaxID=1279 RepID=UPI00064621C6|nr:MULTISPECIES: hypothetical protein [Staphylococcus]
MRKIKDLTGKTFNGIKVIDYFGQDKHKKAKWEVVCHCGNKFVTIGNNLQKGTTKSCGCTQNIKHGDSKKRLYRIWINMIRRCSIETETHFNRYGGRGIKVCDEWVDNYLEFKEWAMKNGYDEKLSIDRIDNNGNYTPENCRWVDVKTQSNNRETNVLIKYQGVERTLKEWCTLLNLNYNTVHYRYAKGYGIDEMFKSDLEDE